MWNFDAYLWDFLNMTWDKFKALLFCKFGFHLWQFDEKKEFIKTYHRTGVERDMAYRFYHCEVCQNTKSERIY